MKKHVKIFYSNLESTVEPLEEKINAFLEDKPWFDILPPVMVGCAMFVMVIYEEASKDE
jgi:hypothetical protein